MTDFHLWEVTCHGRGKEQPKNLQKKKCKLILLGIDHIFLTVLEEKAEPSQSVLYEKQQQQWKTVSISLEKHSV